MNSADTFKKHVFDAALFTYSAGVILFLANPLNSDEASQAMPKLALAAALTALAMFATTALLQKLEITTLGDILFHKHRHAPAFFKSFWGLHLTATFVVTILVSLKVTEFSLTELADPRGLQGASRLFYGLTHANLALLPTAIAQVFQTIFIAFLATVIAVPIAFLLGFLGAKNIMTHPTAFAVYATTRAALNIVRSVEPLIWALIFTVWVGVGPFAGMLALMLHTVASLAKQYSEIVEDVNENPIDGVRSSGANAIQVIWFAIVPQVLLPYIAFTIYRWDTNVRMATVIGLVGGGGIGTLLMKYQGQAMWPEVGCIILVIAVAVWVMDLASAYLREALR